MRRRELWVIAARPSMGKSALMLHMARRTRALIFSLEMPAEQVLNRMICAEAGVPYGVAYQQIGDLDQRDRWLAASERLERMTGMIVDKPGMTTAKMQAIASRAIAEHGINAVYIDHLNYVSDQFRFGNEQEKTGELVRRCKQLANVCDVPVVLISQLNREAESREGCMPRMSDLRSSGRIEEDADFVGLLYRRLYYVNRGMIDAKPELDWVTASNRQKVQLMVTKNRNGETGTAWLGWDASAMSFHETRAA
jgi:replicative DNA helicase